MPHLAYGQTNSTENIFQPIVGKDWKEGDVIIGSATIVAFFSFAFLTDITFVKKRSGEQMVWINVIFACAAVTVFSHLLSILLIMLHFFSEFLYSCTIGITMISFVLILISLREFTILKRIEDDSQLDSEFEDFNDNVVDSLNLP